VCCPDKPNPAGEASQDSAVNQTQVKRKRGGQKGNRNARKHGFFSAALSPAEASELWNAINLEDVDPEVALIRVKLQSSLERDPGNHRVIREASRLLVKRYCERYELDRTERSYLKTVIDLVLVIASLRHSAGLVDPQTQIDPLSSLLSPPCHS
jgi:hypothetical protein